MYMATNSYTDTGWHSKTIKQRYKRKITHTIKTNKANNDQN